MLAIHIFSTEDEIAIRKVFPESLIEATLQNEDMWRRILRLAPGTLTTENMKMNSRDGKEVKASWATGCRPSKPNPM